MHRCLQLALLGGSHAAPNPMVGSVLVYEDRIIGEGYHQQYGCPHAEVNCIASVQPEDEFLIPQSTIYVSLEPCAHFGKTPPCADLIIRKRIPKVVVGCRDPFVQVNGKGIEKLQAAGVEVTVGVLEEACQLLNKRFFTFNTAHRPFIVLKWAQTGDGKIGASPSAPNRLLISNAYTNRLVHKWRSEEAAILVGTNTALLDNPELTTRSWPGKNPIRLVVDLNLRLPRDLKLFNGEVPVIVFNKRQHTIEAVTAPFFEGVNYYQVTDDVSIVHQIVHALYQLKIQSVLVEGGAQLLQSFIDEGVWDEAYVITNEQLIIGDGLPAPVLKQHQFKTSDQLFSDRVKTYKHIPGNK